ncbi:MAG: glyoxylate/hydroxypyruvate reductase A [Proteobacteria bacterium]|jgi:glyoxylate/hydroxypyruvate reductase A|nr:glyoxylate/hydroxypyruvate reductase A [Candidatus Fonsibacter sp. PEL4]
MLPKADIDEWLKVLKKKLPKERIVKFSSLKKSDYKKIDVAIVANPNPTEVKKLINLKWVQSVWAGVEKLVESFKGEKVKIIRLVDPEMNRTMAEAVLSWVLYLHRDMHFYRIQQNKRIWKENDYIKPSKKIVSFIGLGELGSASAVKLIKNGFNVCGWSRGKKNISKVKSFTGKLGLKKMLKQTDILVCLIPLTKQTKYLLNYKTLSYLKRGASIINFARGAVINVKDLVRHLNSGKIKHAVLDVFEQEPLPKASILWKHKNVTVLPHISAHTNMETASDIFYKNIRMYRLKNRIPKSVDKVRGY